MIDRHLLPIQRRLLAPAAVWLAARGISANAVTLTGFAIGMTAVPLIASGLYGIGLLAILTNRFLDGLDGTIARIGGATDRGAFLDITFDFFFYAAIPLAFALADPGANALAASALLVAFVGTGSSFLAFATIAVKRGVAAPDFPDKGFYYLGGLTEGAETIAFFTAICLWPSHFAILAWIFAAACLLTTVIRWHAGWRAFVGE